MHHLFCGLDVTPLSHVPFASPSFGEQRFHAVDLGWRLSDATPIRFLPCLGGFVGSDILAGIVAIDFCRDDALRALIASGTNGEIALGNRGACLSLRRRRELRSRQVVSVTACGRRTAPSRM